MTLVAAIIPARSGSVRIKKKNVREFRGRPIIEYPIEQIKRSGLFDICIVSTDDPDIAELAIQNKCAVHMRETDDGKKGTQEVARDVLLDWPEVTHACVVYATSPLLDSSDLDRGWGVLQRKDALFAMSVQTDPLADAGCFYWGKAEAFKVRAPLIDSHTAMVPMPNYRVQDVNVESDWLEAERKYDAWKHNNMLNARGNF